MNTYCDSTAQILNNLLSYCDTALKTTVTDPSRASVLTDLPRSVCALEDFVRGYQWIDNSSLDTDVEILNWAFGEMPTDFSSAIWLLASGFYKASASSLRNALDISTASLYFQTFRRRSEPRQGGYRKALGTMTVVVLQNGQSAEIPTSLRAALTGPLPASHE